MKLTSYQLLTPTFIFDKTEDTVFGSVNLTNVEFNTKFEVSITKRAVRIIIRIFGFGIYLEFKHGEGNE